MKTICLDLDDGSVLRNRWDLLLKLKEFYPNLKLSLFFIPWDFEYETSDVMKIQREKYLKTLKENLDWIEIIPHGVSHMRGTYGEFEKADKETTRMALQAIEEMLTKDGIPFVKGFKAPYWQWNQNVVEVLDEAGWFGAVDLNQPQMLCTKKFYKYNLDIADEFWKSNLDLWKLHGHMTEPSKNNLSDCLLNLMHMPHDAEFKFVSELLEDK